MPVVGEFALNVPHAGEEWRAVLSWYPCEGVALGVKDRKRTQARAGAAVAQRSTDLGCWGGAVAASGITPGLVIGTRGRSLQDRQLLLLTSVISRGLGGGCSMGSYMRGEVSKRSVPRGYLPSPRRMLRAVAGWKR